MGLLDKLFNRNQKSLPEPNHSTNNSNIYDNFGVIEPFTALTSSQLSNFLSHLSQNQELTPSEQEAFTRMWNAMCCSYGESDNGIWNLKNGFFTIFEKDNITIQYDKKPSEIDKYEDTGRASFAYKSSQGNFIIHQNERNKNIFLVYLSEYVTERLITILRYAEAESLDLKQEKSFVPRVSINSQPSISNRGLASSDIPYSYDKRYD